MSEERKIIRMRHDAVRRRELVVAEKRQLAPNYLSIRFTSDDLEGFISAGADDHVKLFVPGAHENGKPVMRDYTPRGFDIGRGEFVIDFALHHNPGPATAWAIAAKVGDEVAIGGPRGSVVIPQNYDWYWLIGDETALPAIARRLTEWPQASVTTIVAVDGPGEEIPLPTGATRSLIWVHRPAFAANDPAALLAALSTREIPSGDGFVWIAAEAGVAKALRERLIEMGQPATQMKSAGYWSLGTADVSERLD